jgi:hypothetical protein
MAGLFSRIKNWISLENLTAADLNDEFNNVLNNFDPDKMNDWSASTAQMQTTTDPGLVGSENPATSLSGEIERLRYKIKQIGGGAQWYSDPGVNLSDINSYLNGLGQLSGNRISDGKKDANGTPIFLKPSGSTNAVTLKASSVEPFECYIDGTLYTFTSDITLSGLTVAPSSQNTAVITNSDFNTTDKTKVAGLEYVVCPMETYTTAFPDFQERQIELGTIGTNITALNNVVAVYKLITGGNSEYVIGPLQDSNKFTAIYRGWFFDSSDANIPAIALTQTTSTVQLMKASWIFLKSGGTLDVTYNPPTYSSTQPATPSTGDYWYDFSADTWKRYNGSSFVSAGAILVGVCAQDTSNTVCARSADFFVFTNNLNNVEFNVGASSTSSFVPASMGQKISVFGNTMLFDAAGPTLSFTADKDGSFTAGTSRHYIVYVTNTGSLKWSETFPIYRFREGLGWAHPSKPWRAVGFLQCASSSTFSTTGFFSVCRWVREYKHWTSYVFGISATTSFSGVSVTGSTTLTTAFSIKIRGRNNLWRFGFRAMSGLSLAYFNITRNTTNGAAGASLRWDIDDAMSTTNYDIVGTQINESNMVASTSTRESLSSATLVSARPIPERDYLVSFKTQNFNTETALLLSSSGSVTMHFEEIP